MTRHYTGRGDERRPISIPVAAALDLSDVAVGPPAWLTLLLAAACGLMVANIYYAQPLIGPISAALGLPATAAGLIVTMAQIGYGVGLLLIVPLADMIENRRLVLGLIVAAVVALVMVALSSTAVVFLGAILLVGASSAVAQVLVPYAAHLAPEPVRGRVVGTVVSGVLLGIMLSRPAASLLTAIG